MDRGRSGSGLAFCLFIKIRYPDLTPKTQEKVTGEDLTPKLLKISLIGIDMATWQFDLRLIPRHSSGHDGLWSVPDITSLIDTHLQTSLPLGETWTDDIRVYGALDTSCVKLLTLEDGQTEITVRLDLRNLTRDLVIRLLELAHEIDGVFLVAGREKEIEPELKVLLKEIRRSSAYRFVSDPERFLATLS